MEGDRGQQAMLGLKQARLLKFEYLIEQNLKAFGLKDANGAFWLRPHSLTAPHGPHRLRRPQSQQ